MEYRMTQEIQALYRRMIHVERSANFHKDLKDFENAISHQVIASSHLERAKFIAIQACRPDLTIQINEVCATLHDLLASAPDDCSVSYASGWSYADWRISNGCDLDEDAPGVWSDEAKINGFWDRLSLEREKRRVAR